MIYITIRASLNGLSGVQPRLNLRDELVALMRVSGGETGFPATWGGEGVTQGGENEYEEKKN